MRAAGPWAALAVATMAIVTCASPGPPAPPGAKAAPSAPREAPRTLLVLLDAIPFALLDELTDPALGEAALFRDFERPVPLVSTFPSTTSVATVGLFGPLGLAPSPGYEARFFDWSARRVRGGGPISFFRIDFPWREFFDWSRKGVVRSTLSGARPVRSSVHRVRRAVRAFTRAEGPLFTVYVETTDTAAHLRGPDKLAPIFEALDRAITEARREAEAPFRVVILSDHGLSGGEPLVNVWGPLRRTLRAAGWRIARRLRRPRDVALTPFGLVSSFEIYTAPESRAEVARLAASVEGVDLCAFPDGEGWAVVGAGGRARIDRRRDEAGDRWRYRPESGDPLDYAALAASLAGSETAAGGGFFGDRAWFEASRDHQYPDALFRIAAGFELVGNPASAICSCAPGHMYGLKFTEWGARITSGRLRWTHGALHRGATNGFLLTDVGAWTPDGAVRFSRALVPLAVDTGRAEPGDTKHFIW